MDTNGHGREGGIGRIPFDTFQRRIVEQCGHFEYTSCFRETRQGTFSNACCDIHRDLTLGVIGNGDTDP